MIWIDEEKIKNIIFFAIITQIEALLRQSLRALYRVSLRGDSMAMLTERRPS